MSLEGKRDKATVTVLQTPAFFFFPAPSFSKRKFMTGCTQERDPIFQGVVCSRPSLCTVPKGRGSCVCTYCTYAHRPLECIFNKCPSAHPCPPPLSLGAPGRGWVCE